MKNKKPILFSAMIVVLFSIAMIGGCKKDSNNNTDTDWATSLTGVYTNDEIVGGTYHAITTFTVTKAGNKNIFLKIDRAQAGSFVSPIHSCFDSITLSTSTTFNVNETDSCETAAWGIPGIWITGFGSGSFTPNSLTMNWSRVFNPSSGASGDTLHYSMIATK